MTLAIAAAQAAEINAFNSNAFILQDIEPDFNVELMTSKAQLGSPKIEKIFHDLINEARTLARPRAAFKICRIEPGPGTEVFLDNVSFTGQLLRDNLAGRDWAYAYVSSEGDELAQWFESLSNVGQILSWPIRYAALKLAEKALTKFIMANFGTSQLSSMNPGALNLWPLEQQNPLFSLLFPLPEAIGVSLDSKSWMSPDLASSGVFFETETKFYNCQLCPLEPCERRKTVNLGPEAGWPKPRIDTGNAA